MRAVLASEIFEHSPLVRYSQACMAAGYGWRIEAHLHVGIAPDHMVAERQRKAQASPLETTWRSIDAGRRLRHDHRLAAERVTHAMRCPHELRGARVIVERRANLGHQIRQ